MTLLFTAAHTASAVDPVARTLSIISLVVTIASVCGGCYLYHRAGPRLTVTCFLKADTGQVRINAANKGRTAATIRAVELRDYTAISTGSAGTTLSRWSLPAVVTGEPLPRTLQPTDYLEANIDGSAALAKGDGAASIVVKAFVQRGDGKWISPRRPIRIR
jgi:hypothetical protein